MTAAPIGSVDYLMQAVMIPAITVDMISAVTMVVLMTVVTRRTKIAHAGSSVHEK